MHLNMDLLNRTFYSAQFWPVCGRLGSAVLVTLILGVVFACSGRHTTQAGDAKIIDAGMLSPYPRYRIELPCVSVDSSARSSLLITSAPTESYMLRVVARKNGESIGLDDWADTWNDLQRMELDLEVAVIDREAQPEAVVAEFAGKLPGSWGPAAWGGERFFCSEETNEVRLSGREYAVEIDVDSRMGHSDRASYLLCPVFVGGGTRH